MPFLRRLSAAIDGLNDRIGAAIRWLALAMVLVGAFNALARYATRYTDVSLSSNAYLDLQWYFFSLIFLLGAAYGLNHDVHVRVDVLYSQLSRRARAWIDLLGGILFLVPFTVLMLYVSWPAVRNSWSIREVSPDPGGLPRYPIKAVILVGFALLLLQGVSQIVKQVDILWGAGPPEGPEGEGPDQDDPTTRVPVAVGDAGEPERRAGAGGADADLPPADPDRPDPPPPGPHRPGGPPADPAPPEDRA